MKVARLASLVRDFAGGAVVGVLTATPGVNRDPEVIEHVAVGVPAFAGGKPDLPDANSRVFAEQPGSDVTVVSVLGEVVFEPVGPPVEVGGDEVAGEGKVGQKVVVAHRISFR